MTLVDVSVSWLVWRVWQCVITIIITNKPRYQNVVRAASPTCAKISTTTYWNPLYELKPPDVPKGQRTKLIRQRFMSCTYIDTCAESIMYNNKNKYQRIITRAHRRDRLSECLSPLPSHAHPPFPQPQLLHQKRTSSYIPKPQTPWWKGDKRCKYHYSVKKESKFISNPIIYST